MTTVVSGLVSLFFPLFFFASLLQTGLQHTPWIRLPRQEAGVLLGAQAGRHGRPKAPKEDPSRTLLTSTAAESAPPGSKRRAPACLAIAWRAGGARQRLAGVRRRSLVAGRGERGAAT